MKTSSLFKSVVFVITFVLVTNELNAQKDLLNQAIKFAQQGNHQEAEKIFASISDSPELGKHQVEIARAYNFSWSKEYQKAALLFQRVLTEDPQSIEGFLGMGYTNYWRGNHHEAKTYFSQALHRDKKNRSALIGQAYTAIQAKDYAHSERMLILIEEQYPEDPETHYIKGLLALKKNKNGGARKAFKKALSLNPSYDAALNGLKELESGPKKFEFGVWYGATFNETENQNGLRRVDLKYQVNSKNQLFAFYDNALALDNNVLAVQERTAPLVGLGAKHDWNNKWFSKLEAGRRFLTLTEDQYLVNLETGYFVSQKLLAKLVTQMDFRGDDQLASAGAFLDYELFKNMRIEGGFFHSHNLTFSNTYNQRFLLSPKIKYKKIEAIVGAYFDRLQTPQLSVSQIGGGYGLITFPILENLQGKLFGNYDRGLFNNEIAIVSIGTNYKF